MEEMIRVLFCQRNRHPEEREVENKYEIFAEFPRFDYVEKYWFAQRGNGVVLIYNNACDRDGEHVINRVLLEGGAFCDVTVGGFFITAMENGEYRSLTDEEIEKIDPHLQLLHVDLWEIEKTLRGDTDS